VLNTRNGRFRQGRVSPWMPSRSSRHHWHTGQPHAAGGVAGAGRFAPPRRFGNLPAPGATKASSRRGAGPCPATRPRHPRATATRPFHARHRRRTPQAEGGNAARRHLAPASRRPHRPAARRSAGVKKQRARHEPQTVATPRPEQGRHNIGAPVEMFPRMLQ